MIQVKKNEKEISGADYQQALHGLYRVWMVTPQGDTATLAEYEMDQEAMEEFLEDYTRFAEILIRVEVLEEATTAQTTAAIAESESPAV